jgi:O-antigen/teichoic acid export membrane protein
VASVDQAALSALSFLISIILIKNVPKIEYGYYSIGFSIALFLICIQNSIINTPLAVLLITKNGSEKRTYTASLGVGQFIVILPVVCLGFAITAILKFVGLDATQAAVAAAICFAAIGILFREFLRAYFFAEEKPQQVLKIDLFYVLTFISGIGIIYFFFKISTSLIFILMGISGIIAGLIFCRVRDYWPFHQLSIKKSYIENWKYGKWALLGVIVWHIQNYSYLYLLGALLGGEAVAEVSAARLLMMPMILFREGWMKIVVPYGSRLREQRKLNRFFKEQIVICLIFGLIVVLYTAVIMSLSDFLQTMLFTQKYSDSINYILFYSVLFIIGFFGVNANYGLQVTKHFDIITKINFLTMLVTLACTYFLIKGYGIKGCLTALIVGEALVAGILWYNYAKIVFLGSTNCRFPRTKKVMASRYTK